MNDERNVAPVHRSTFAVQRWIAALWFGAGVFLAAFAAPAAFRAASNPTEAANVVGAMLTRWHYLALLAPLILLVIQWSRPRAAAVIVLFIAVVLASAEALVDVRIRDLRMHSAISISALPPASPVRRRFGLLHGASSLLLLGQIVAAGVAIGVSDSGTDR